MTDKCGITEYCEMRTGDICTLGSPCPHQKPLTNKEYMRTCSDDELVSLLCELVDSGILQEWRIGYHCADSDEDAVRMWLKEKRE